uniref:Phosphatidylethanolamine N-methyltransferase n=1 Tax=Sinocyclocheilus grahami TaxID=75366 RepID=A0A672KUY5_SINGR
ALQWFKTDINTSICWFINITSMDMSVLAELWRLTDLTEPRFCVAVIAIIFNPFFWNEVARWEHRTRGLTRLFGGPYVACYSLAVLILLLSYYCGHEGSSSLENAHMDYAGAALVALGSVFVISSFMALGVTCTFLSKSIHLCFCSTSILSYTSKKKTTQNICIVIVLLSTILLLLLK